MRGSISMVVDGEGSSDRHNSAKECCWARSEIALLSTLASLKSVYVGLISLYNVYMRDEKRVRVEGALPIC
jgi:hypothetical protein